MSYLEVHVLGEGPDGPPQGRSGNCRVCVGPECLVGRVQDAPAREGRQDDRRQQYQFVQQGPGAEPVSESYEAQPVGLSYLGGEHKEQAGPERGMRSPECPGGRGEVDRHRRKPLQDGAAASEGDAYQRRDHRGRYQQRLRRPLKGRLLGPRFRHRQEQAEGYYQYQLHPLRLCDARPGHLQPDQAGRQ